MNVGVQASSQDADFQALRYMFTARLLNHLIVLSLVLGRVSILFSVMVIIVYIRAP